MGARGATKNPTFGVPPPARRYHHNIELELDKKMKKRDFFELLQKHGVYPRARIALFYCGRGARARDAQ